MASSNALLHIEKIYTTLTDAPVMECVATPLPSSAIYCASIYTALDINLTHPNSVTNVITDYKCHCVTINHVPYR
jgi:hypothetical protein